MSDLAPDHFPGHPPVRAPGNDSDGFARGNATLIEQWAAVEDAARVVALLAGQPAPDHDASARMLIARLTRADAGRVQASILALDELVATMRFGLDALLAAHGTSADPRPAANCLWREYERGRAATLREAALATRS
ncbi:hypothetical protein I5L01_01970 [Erythrobacter sp. YJ-T3-07]|uniref:hypothetical protein n=1 Tax=Erythrobacter sp. YJ-T3-07 TaxID=2793063 RepID=UPI0018D4177A|nr:hypothetical protein [Erythrobacter sp. YJ-T3-07]MBH1942990.1 hypothetical protein [Erythrobacter sp. YJ-T3-07]